jgi:hypothetical protein
LEITEAWRVEPCEPNEDSGRGPEVEVGKGQLWPRDGARQAADPDVHDAHVEAGELVRCHVFEPGRGDDVDLQPVHGCASDKRNPG